MEMSGSFTPRPLYPQGKSPWYPLYMRLDGPHTRYGRDGEDEKSLPGHPIRSLVTVLTELPRFPSGIV